MFMCARSYVLSQLCSGVPDSVPVRMPFRIPVAVSVPPCVCCLTHKEILDPDVAQQLHVASVFEMLLAEKVAYNACT